MLTLDVLNMKGEKVDTVTLAADVFEVKATPSLVHEVVTAYLANERRGTHSTKTRGEVSGGGAKPWKQKHTGNARAGSSRSPLWRHGGIAFGPKPRSYNQAIPPAKRRLALKAVLSSFLRDGKFRVIDDLVLSEPKTKKGMAVVKSLNLAPKSLLVVASVSEVTERALRNIPTVRYRLARDLNSYQALLADELVVTRAALAELSKRLGDPSAVEVSK
ncbi:MAG: 50S ribosomal protein L4 [Elusimicrobia bacterium]|jgi:large subunit ribosomal protein L4|nr:50S ribosomal protein L4 [Elusimicrobiota bacterium]